MKVEVFVDASPEELVAAEILAGERAVTAAMSAAGRGLKADWRAAVVAAGLGQRLGNTVRARHFPAQGESLAAAALVWTNAPEIMRSHDDGVLIRSPNGFYLAIPLAAAGRLARMRAGNGRFEGMTPGAFERRSGMRLRFVYRPGRNSLLVADDARVNSRGVAARRGGRRRRDGILTGAQTIPVFLLVRQVKMPKRIDVAGLADAAAARLPGLILQNWRDPR